MAHKTEEIARADWSDWLARLGNRFRAKNTRIEVVGRDIGAQHLAEMPLVGISFDTKEEPQEIEITVARQPPGGPAAEHVIERPKRLFAELDDEGEVEVVEIEDAEDHRTLLYFSREEAAPSP